MKKSHENFNYVIDASWYRTTIKIKPNAKLTWLGISQSHSIGCLLPSLKFT